MTVQELKSAICAYFNARQDFSCPFIVSPTTAPAPVGTYVAVSVLSVRQDGSMMQPAPNLEDGKVRFQQIANIALYEVEGDGDTIRRVRNAVQMPGFIEALKNAGATVWNFGEVTPIDSYDGEFHIRQWVTTFEANFEDEESLSKETILTADPTISAEEI